MNTNAAVWYGKIVYFRNKMHRNKFLLGLNGWLGFNGILSTQVAAISCLRKFKVC